MFRRLKEMPASIQMSMEIMHTLSQCICNNYDEWYRKRKARYRPNLPVQTEVIFLLTNLLTMNNMCSEAKPE